LVAYDELLGLATAKIAQNDSGETLQARTLVREAYTRLTGADPTRQRDNFGQFTVVAAKAMRRIMFERAQRNGQVPHDCDTRRVDLDEACSIDRSQSDDFVELDRALTDLAGLRPFYADLVELRFFAGLNASEAARTFGISRSTVERYRKEARTALLELQQERPAIQRLSATERDSIIARRLRDFLAPLRLREITPRRWIDGSTAPVRRLFEIELRKGASLKACWGFSLKSEQQRLRPDP
jgi:RNA polymerase sigma factor (TIGR02999 family)